MINSHPVFFFVVFVFAVKNSSFSISSRETWCEVFPGTAPSFPVSIQWRLVRTIDIDLLWEEVRFLLTYTKKTLSVNHCSKIMNGQLTAWFTNQHLAAFDQNCLRLVILFYDLLVDFISFPRILFSSSSKTDNQLLLAACSVSNNSFLTKFRSTFSWWLSFIDEERKFMF